MDGWSSRRDLADKLKVDPKTIHRWAQPGGSVEKLDRPGKHPLFRLRTRHQPQPQYTQPQYTQPQYTQPQYTPQHRAPQAWHPAPQTWQHDATQVWHGATQVGQMPSPTGQRVGQSSTIKVGHSTPAPSIHDVVAAMRTLQAESDARLEAIQHNPESKESGQPTWAKFLMVCLPFGGITWWAVRDAKKRQAERRYRQQLQQQLVEQRKILEMRRYQPAVYEQRR